jgi:hypothetical protein
MEGSVAVDFTVAAVPSAGPDLVGEGFVVALTVVAFVVAAFAAIGSGIATSMTGLSFSAILAIRSFTIPTRIMDTLPTGTILTVTHTILTINLFTELAVDIATL